MKSYAIYFLSCPSPRRFLHITCDTRKKEVSFREKKAQREEKTHQHPVGQVVDTGNNNANWSEELVVNSSKISPRKLSILAVLVVALWLTMTIEDKCAIISSTGRTIGAYRKPLKRLDHCFASLEMCLTVHWNCKFCNLTPLYRTQCSQSHRSSSYPMPSELHEMARKALVFAIF